MTLSVVTILASLAWLINLGSLVVDVVPKHSVATVFSVVATGSTIGGIIMNMVVAATISGPSAKPAGSLDHAVRTVFGGLLELVQGRGYALWFFLSAFLHPLALIILFIGGVHRRR